MFPTSPIQRRLCASGLALFFVGLPLGFAIHALPNPRVALSAHLNAVQSGTALMVLGLLWPRLRAPRWATVLAHLLWLSFWGLEAGLVLASFIPADHAGGAGNAGWLGGAVRVVGGASSIVMLLAVGAVLAAFVAQSAERRDGALPRPERQ
jgi:hydroxylaminobenzene mutase